MLVEAAAASQPDGRLIRDAGDRIEVSVVMDEGQAMLFGDRGDDQIRWRRPTMLASFSKLRLRFQREPVRRRVRGECRQKAKVGPEPAVIGT